MKIDVLFFVQRHGAHDGTNLTSEGKERVRRQAIKYLSTMTFHRAYSSEVPRAQQTVQEALCALHQAGMIPAIQVERGFGYAFADDPRWPHSALLKQIDEADVPVTVDYVLNELRDPPCLKMAGALLMTMHHLARSIAGCYRNSNESEINVLVGGHGTNVLASTCPEKTPWADYGDIMMYWFAVDYNGNSELMSSMPMELMPK